MFSFQRDDSSKLDRWRSARRKVTLIQDIKKVLKKSYQYLAIKDSKKNVYEDLLLALEGYSLYYEEAFKGWLTVSSNT